MLLITQNYNVFSQCNGNFTREYPRYNSCENASAEFDDYKQFLADTFNDVNGPNDGDLVFTLPNGTPVDNALLVWIDDGNVCSDRVITVDAELICNGNNYELLGSAEFTIHAPPQPPQAIRTSDNCDYILIPTCPGDVLAPIGPFFYPPGSTNETISVTVTTTNGCSGTPFDVEVEDCPAQDICPISPVIEGNSQTDNVDICSGESIDITGSFDDTDATTAGNIAVVITPPGNFPNPIILDANLSASQVFPENTTCDPLTYTVTGTAVCNGNNIPSANTGDLFFTVTVYPEFDSNNPNWIVTEGGCGQASSLVPFCSNYEVSVSPDDPPIAPAPGGSVTDTYTIEYTNDPNSCFDPGPIVVNSNCDPDCPTNPMIEVDAVAVCGNEEATITGMATGETGDRTMEFTIIESTGAVSVTEGVPFNLPANNSCDPITYTFTAIATCVDGGGNDVSTVPAASPDDLIITITVFPEYNASFLTGVDGTCDAASTVDSSCPNYTITGTGTQPDAGDSGTDNFIVNYNDPDFPGCWGDASFEVPFNCNPNCPSIPSISVDDDMVCSGDQVTISGVFGDTGAGGTDGTFTLSESTGILIIGANINNEFAVTLPQNDNCDPVTYTFTALATCSDGSPIGANSIDDVTVTVTVFPNFNEDLLVPTGGTCDNPTGLESTCEFYEITGTDFQAPPGQVGNQSYTINYNDANACFADEPFDVPYSCNDACPADPSLVPHTSELCSGATITLNANFGQSGTLDGNFAITELSNTITGITLGNSFSMPQNTSCDPITYTFLIEATCDDNSPIFPNLTTTITVYPNFNSDLVQINEGFCNSAGSLTALCDNYDVSPSGTPTNPQPGDSGNDTWNVDYIGGIGGNCFNTEQIQVPYVCSDDCPSDPSITASTQAVCSGGTATITGDFGNDGSLTGTFTITENTGTISVTDGNSFTLPTNTGCEPVVYLFTATATCEDNTPIFGANMTATITVYPDFNADFLIPTNGICGTAGTLSTSCSNYSLTSPTTPTVPQPGANGNDAWTVDYNYGSPAPNPLCFQGQTFQVPYACNNDCPSDPSITASTQAVCSGGTATITGAFGTLGTGALTGTFTITELTGTIPSVVDGQAFTLPTNTTCDPITYSFSATAVCSDVDQTPIFGNNMTTTITVYPAFNPDFVTTNGGSCGSAGSVQSSCANYTLNSPAGGPTVPTAGQSGTDTWSVEYDYSNFSNPPASPCFTGQDINVIYACNDNCPADPVLSVDVNEICSGGSVAFTTAFNTTGTLTGSFSITETTGTITGISSGSPISLPANTGCDPVNYTFTALATCDDADNTPIFGTNLTQTITVYPEFNADLVSSIQGSCGNAGQLQTACPNYLITPPPSPTIPAPGNTGTDPWTVSYNGGPNSGTCFSDEEIEVAYSCNPDCPAQPSITSTTNEVCGDGSATATIKGAFGDTGSGALTGSFIITESTGTISVTDNTAFTLPANNGCDPQIYTFTAQATCSDNSIIPGPIADMSVTITVYPIFNVDLFNDTPGSCGVGGSLTTSCANYSLTPPSPITVPNPGDTGIDEWTVTYTGGGNCISTETIEVNYSCNEGCPAQPSISVNTTEVCSEGSVTITGVFGNTDGGLTGSFTILDPSGEIAGTITDGSPFNLPANTGCDPVDYTFTADATCEDGSLIAGSTEDLTVVVTVYPDFNNDFLNITAGSCGTAGILTTSCANYDLTAPSTPTEPQPGDEGEDTWTVEYTGGGSCISTETVLVPYSCNEDCPTQPSISVDNSAVCSGGSVDVTGIFGNVGGGLSGTFNISDPSGTIAPVNNIASDTPTNISLPENDGCEPVTYSLTAEARCEDNSIIAGSISDMTATVTVYPDFNATLISTVDGNCITPGSASSSCEFYLINGNTTLPGPGETGSDNLTVDYNYQGNTPAGGACFEAAEVTVDYACSSSCPAQPRITADITNLCSGGSAKIDGTFGQPGSEGGTITITEAGGTITGIVNGQTFTLPTNNSCDPVSYTFTATATCDDGTDIPGTATDLTLQITVYPEFDPEFINITNGACGEAGTATSICDFYALSPEEETIPDTGEAGTDTWTVEYNDPDAPNCFAGASFEVPYNCGAACPAEPFIEADELDVCSGESVTITGSFGQSGAGLGGSFSISEAGGTITSIQNGVSFSLPTNNGCDPVSYTFLATATCEDNSIINPAAPEDMSVTVRVYPVFNEAFIEIEPGNCDGPGSAESTCPNYDVQAAGSPTFPNAGEVGEDEWVVNYINAPVTCFVNEPIAVPYNCGVACPSSPFLEANSTEICSGGTITLEAGFNDPQGSGSFTLIDVSGTITGIQNGVPISLPENTGCEPVTYTFSASASCSGNPIPPDNPNDVLVTVTVYPDFNEDLVKANPGTCDKPGTLDVICTNYRPTPPGDLITPAAGESGSQIWTVDYIGGINCFTSIPIDVPYACDVSCPEQPRISADNTELCSGGQVRISGAFGVPSNIQPDFEITETSGAITGIVNGTSFTVPENTSCDPIDYIFTAVAFCNGAPIDNANNQDMTVTITVYPTFNDNFISVTNGDCGVPGKVISTCDNYEINALTTTTPGQGESGTDTWSINYTGSTCIVNEIVQVPYSCGVTCPAGPSISSDKTLVCGGESISIVGIFANTDGGQGGYFEITELSGKIENIQNGIEFTIPPNNQCDPITYTFSAEAFCDDNTPVFGSSTDLTLSITVYPEYNDNFVNFEPGTCDNVGVATSICDNYRLIAQSQTQAESGESGFDIWTVEYISSDDFVCFNNATFNVPYSCGQSCPSAPIIDLASGSNEFCGGSSITINGLFRNVSDLTGSFEITETSNTIQNIESGIAFQLPNNNDCNPQTYTFAATAFCVDGTEIAGNTSDLTISVTVYPAFNNELIEIVPGNCTSTGSITLLCSNYEAIAVDDPTLPEPGESGDDAWLINYIAPNGGGFGCFAAQEIEVPFGCGVSCPSGPSIEADNINICSGDKARISGFTQEGADATFSISDTKGEFLNIANGQPFDLPINNGCEPITYTFTATARCSDGTNIPSDNPADMTVSITVYPEFNDGLIRITPGTCGTPGTAAPICNNYELAVVGSPTNPDDGESGEDTWVATYKNTTKSCFSAIEFAVPYNCNVSCPSSPSINTSNLTVCSGAEITIAGSFLVAGGQGTDGSFTITENSNQIENISNNIPFRLPVNTSCNPQQYTFRATARCSDGTEIQGETENMTLTITVYPEYNSNFISINSGTCDVAGFASTTCPNYTLIAPDERTIPEEGESGQDIWILNYQSTDNNLCIDNINVAVPYSCALNCPSGPKLNADVLEVCSGEQVVLSGSFATSGADFLSASFSLTELSGRVDNIEVDGDNISIVNLPSNTSCDPVNYTFIGSVTCNGNPITATNPNDLQIIITVYPEYNENLIAIQKGNCDRPGKAIPTCDNYEVQGLGSPTIPNQGETGFDQWQVNYVGGNPSNQICIDPIIIDVPYGCGNACPQDPRIIAELASNSDYFGNILEVCGGESVIFRSSFGIDGDLNDGSFAISSTDLADEIPIGEAFELPANNGCDPVNYTFLGSATCDDGTPILGSSERIIVTITVYPNALNLDFITLEDGTCDAAGIATSTCDNYQLTAPTSPPPTIPSAGESGKDRWALSYVGPTPPSGTCTNRVNISVSYDCEENCPINPFIEADVQTVCSGDMATIATAFRDTTAGGLATTFDIRLQSDTTQKVTPNTLFNLPENNGCEPIVVTYEARVFCGNGEEIFGDQGDLVTQITVYPKPGTPQVISHSGGCGLALQTDCNNLEIEYFNPNQEVWETSPYLNAPFDGDSIEWRAYHKDYSGSCQTTGTAYASGCPQVDNGCPYPVIFAKRSTLDSQNPNSPQSNNGPVVLVATFPISLQPSNFNLADITYEWGYYNDNQRQFIVPGKGSYNTTNWAFSENAGLGRPGNVNQQFYVVNPEDGVTNLRQYGVLVKTTTCSSNNVVIYIGKTMEDLPTVNQRYLQIYPNPNNGNFNLDIMDEYIKGDIQVNIYDYLGRKVHEQAWIKQGYGFQQNIIVPNQTAGVYLVELVINGQKILTEKVIMY